MTLSAIFSFEKIVFLIQGKGKKELLDRLIDEKKEKNETQFPAKMVLKHENTEIYYDET
jgi:6-phosphogluconolactonase/glucosamine-6-phosphate isomerase/deaminase